MMETLHLQAHLKHLEEATMTQSVWLLVVSEISLSICSIIVHGGFFILSFFLHSERYVCMSEVFSLLAYSLMFCFCIAF
jgi:hypothetical protein